MRKIKRCLTAYGWKQSSTYDYDRYDFDQALDLLRPEYATAVIINSLTRENIDSLLRLPFETAIALLHGELVLFTTGNKEEIGVTQGANELLKEAGFISHTHVLGGSESGPSSFDLTHAAPSPSQEYVLTEKGAFAYNRSGLLNEGNPYSFEEYLSSLRQAQETSKEKDQTKARSLLNEFIRQMDLYNEAPEAEREAFRLFEEKDVTAVVQFGNLLYDLAPYGGFTGGVSVASGDVNGDGYSDIITGPGAGGGPHVLVFDGLTGKVIRSFFAYDPSFSAGITVASGDVNGDGKADIITGAGAGGSPHVKVFDAVTGKEIYSFYAYDPSFRGGVRVAAGDVNGDGKADIITGVGPGGGPHVKVFDGATGKEIRSFFAYDPSFSAGITVASGDVNGDGKADIITGVGPGGGPHVKVFDGVTGKEIRSFYAYDASFRGGVRVAAADFNQDGKAEILTAAGPGGGPHVKVFHGETLKELTGLFAFDQTVTAGVFIATGDVNRDGKPDLIAGLGAGRASQLRVLNNTSLTLGIRINQGSLYTSSKSVNLDFHSSDTTSGVSQMRFKAGEGAWSPWETFNSTKAIDLPSSDGQKTVYFQVKDKAGNESAIGSASIILDTTAPSGSVSINNDAAYTTSRNVTLTLTSSDATSGLDAMRFSLDKGATWTAWEAIASTKSLTLPSGDGSKEVQYQLRDKAVLVSTFTDTIILDTTAPTGSVSINNNATYTTSRDITLKLTASDATSGLDAMRFSTDGGINFSNWEAVASSKSLTLPSGDGSKEVQYQLRDKAGLTDIFKDTIILDTTAPSGTLLINNDDVYTETPDVTLTLSASDDTSGVDQMRFSTDGGTTFTDWEAVASSKSLTLPSGDGTKEVRYQLRDKAGLVATFTDTIILDTTAPSGSIQINSGAAYTNSRTVTASLTSSDATSGVDKIRFSLDAGSTWTAWEDSVSSKSLTLPEGDGTKEVRYQVRDKAGNISSFSDTIILDTTPPQITNFSLEEGASVNIPYLVLSYEVVDADAENSSGYQEVDLQTGLNTISVKVTDKAGNEIEVWRHVYYVPEGVLPENWQDLRNRYIEENAAYFQESQGIDPATGFPIDVIGPNAPSSGETWTQPTSIGFYLQLLGGIITKRIQVSFLTATQALSQAGKVLTNLFNAQSQWGWNGLLPWLELSPILKPSNDLIGLIDNANLSHSLAVLAGALFRTNLHRTLGQTIYNQILSFLSNQTAGYQAFVDQVSGVFRGTYNKLTQQFDGYADRFGSELRATAPFLITYFDLPATVWDNLIRSVSRYLTKQGRIVKTFSAFDGGGFQYFWSLLKSPEESLPKIKELLQNALLIHQDFMNRMGLPGFASASSLPEGGYSGLIGIENLKETPLPLDESVGSIYSLAAAFRLAPEFVLDQIQKIEAAFPSLKGSLGFYDTGRANGEISQNYYAIDQGSLVLGLAGHGADDFRIWMQEKNLWPAYQDFYKSTGFMISPAVEALPEPPLGYEEIHNGHADTGNIYSGPYLFDQMSGNGISVEKTADGTFLYTPATSEGWIGGAIDPLIDLSKYSFVSLTIRNKVSGSNQVEFEVKNSDTFLLNQTLSFTDNEWHTFQFFFPKLTPDANFIAFGQAAGAFEVREIRFNDLPLFLGTFPPVMELKSKPLTNQKNYSLEYEINGVPYEETVPLIEGENVIQRIFHDSYHRSAEHEFHITLDSLGPVIELLSATETTHPHYTLSYTIDGTQKEESLALEEGKNFVIRSATDEAGNTTTKTFEIILDSQPPVVELFKINQGSSVTKTAEVTLNLLAYDLGSSVTEMSFSNDGVNFTPAEPFATSKTWTLTDGKGEKTVWVKLKDAKGFWSDPVTASISLVEAFVLDNFEGESQIETYWDIDGTEVYQRSIVEGGAFDGTHAMQVDFQKTPELNFSYFAFHPKQNDVANDFSPYRTLRLHFKKQHEAPMVLLMKLVFNNTSETYETQVGLPLGVSDWQEIIFDFSPVSSALLASVKDVLFFVDPGNGTTEGSFLMDRLELDETAPSKLVDDFEGNNAPVETYWDQDGDLIYQRSITEEGAFDGTHSMKVEFAKQAGYSFSFFALQPKQDGLHNNFTNYDSFRFHLNKISEAPMVILIKFEFNGTEETFEEEFHFPQGSGQWQEVTYDLSQVPESLLASVKNILFFVDPTSETTSGSFLIDRIRLAEKPVLRLVDDFEGNNSLIETYWDGDGAGVVYTRTIDNAQGVDGTHSMRVEYHKTVQYPTSFFAMAPLQDGFANDFSRFNVLKIFVKKTSTPVMRLMMKFELGDTQLNFEAWKEIPEGPTDWTEVAFDFSSLDPAILKNVRAVLFFVDPMFTTASQETQGTFFVDSIRLDFDADLPAQQFDPSKPPQIGWVSASVANDFDNEYHVGSLVRINAWELNAAGDLLDGTVRVVSKSTGYDSGEQKLVFLHDGQFWPFHWDTRGLQVADDYGVIVTLRDKSGNVTTVGSVDQPALTIKLTKGVPPGGQLLGIQDFSLPLLGNSLPVTRAYDPTDADVFDSYLGNGWHLSLDYFVQDFPDGTASLSFGAEGYEFFKQNPDGSYRTLLPNNYSILTKKDRGFELRLKDGTLYEFDSAPFIDLNTKTTVTWFLTKIVDRNLNETQFLYNENRKLTQVVLPSGQSITLEYSFRTRDQFNTNKYNLDRIIDLSGNVWSYEHDVKGNLISTTDPFGQKTSYQYDDRSRLTKITYPDGSTQGYVYDSEGRITQTLRNDILQSEFVYGDRNDPVFSIKDALGRITTYQVSADGLPLEVTDALGNKTLFSYDERQNLTKKIDPQGNVFTFTYDSLGNLLQSVNPLGGVTEFTYEPTFNLVTSLTDALGNKSESSYDSKGNLVLSKDPAGNALEFTYDSKGNRIASKDPLGNVTASAYDSRGLPLTVTDALGNQASYEYDSRGNVTKVTDPKGGVNEFEYDALNRLLTQTDALGRKSTFSYDVMGRRLTQTDALGNVTTFEYDLKGQLLSQTDALGNKTSFAYDAKGNRISQTDGLGNVTTFTYDVLDRLTEVKDPLGRVTSFAYDSLGRRISQTDALGNITRFDYDSLGRRIKTVFANGAVQTAAYDLLERVLSRTDALGNKTRFEYDSRENLISRTDPLGSVTSFEYDARNQRISQTDALGNKTRLEYDALGRLVKTIDPDGATELREYDALNRLISTTDPLSRKVTFDYDAVGNLTKTTDPAGNVTENQYDALNRKVKEIDAFGNATTYTYDALGRVTQILDAKGNATSMQYDALGRLLERIYPDASKETFVYDAVGNLTQSKDRMARATQFAYDVLNRLLERTFADNSKETFTYDVLGRVLTETNAAGTIRNEYDLLGRLTKQIDVFGDILEYTYDPLGNRKSLKAIMGANALLRDYTYDTLGRLTQMEDELARKTSYTYDSRSRVLAKKLPNGTSTEFSYDAASELTQITHKDAAGNSFRILTYTYDDRGLINEKNDSFEGKSTFDYDKLGELISITHPIIGLISFALDALGNRTQVTDDGVSEDYTPNALNEYSAAGNKTFQYDLNGNLTQRLNTATGLKTLYEYDVKDHLTQVTLPDGTLGTFTYDSLGRRITKTVGNQTTRYFWDGGELLAELDPQGNLLRSYVHGPVVDEILYQEDYAKNETLFFHQDNLESTLALTDSQGTVKESFTYDPYGNLINPPSSSSTHFLYTGRELDQETGLYYNRARYYDPSLGRFLSTDPQGYEAGLNLYTYVHDNPLSFRDPEGLDVYWGGGSRGKRGGLKGFFGVLLGIGIGLIAGPIIGAALSAVGSAIGAAAGAVVGGAASLVTSSAVGAAVGSAVGSLVGAAAVAAGTSVLVGGIQNVIQGQNFFAGVGRTASIAAITAGAIKVAGWVGGGIQQLAGSRPSPGIELARTSSEVSTRQVSLGSRIQQSLRNNFFRPEDAKPVLGRESSVLPPGKGFALFIEDFIPAAHNFAVLHDALVGTLAPQTGVLHPANIPTMPPTYIAGVIYSGFGFVQDIIQGDGTTAANT